MKSILQKKKECYLCRYLYKTSNTWNLEEHHCINGNPGRKLSEKYGLKVYLCAEHHRGNNGVHGYRHDFSLFLKQLAQKAFEQKYGHEKWMEVFKRNYINEHTCKDCRKYKNCPEQSRLYVCRDFSEKTL